MILHGLKSCGVTNSLDGDEDDLIHCFKKDQPNESGLQMLKEEDTNEETEENDEDEIKGPELKDSENAEVIMDFE